MPPWVQAEKVSLTERLEIAVYKFISVFPVFVTFGLLTYLISFYATVISLYFDLKIVFPLSVSHW